MSEFRKRVAVEHKYPSTFTQSLPLYLLVVLKPASSSATPSFSVSMAHFGQDEYRSHRLTSRG